MQTPRPTSADVLVVGAGPAGSAAAAWAARGRGSTCVLADAAVFPRDKTCGDGLTPRAIGELQRLGLEDWLRAHTVNQGLRAHGFGQTLLLPVAGRHAARLGLGGRAHRARRPPAHHRDQGRAPRPSTAPARSTYAARATGSRRWCFATRRRARSRSRCRRLVVADGVRSPLGKVLGPRVAPRHRLRRRRPLLRRLDDVRRPVDQLPPRAARRAGRGAVRLRLDLPARHRRGEPRRRHARHRASGRPTSRSSR